MDIRPLPDAYDRDTLQLMVRDPSTVYLYWEVSERKKQMTARHFGCGWEQLPKRIRLYDITRLNFDGSFAHRVWELPASAGGSCYVRDLIPARTYAADLGVANLHNRFIPLLRSNASTTPWDDPGQAQELFAADGANSAALAAERQPYVTLLPEGYACFSAYTVYPCPAGDGI